MKTYPNLISTVCRTEKTTQLVSRTIPILVRWAQSGVTTNTYGDLIKELGMDRFSGIGHVLGCVEDVIMELRTKTGEVIPTLNALVKGKNGLPSLGFNYVYPDYDSYPVTVKIALVNDKDKKATEYPYWDTILQLLCLKPSILNCEINEGLIRNGSYHGVGEGPQHKALKQFIFEHPEAIGLNNVTFRDTEYILLSGDRLDVYFEQDYGGRIAVEVKSRVSPEDDILRGLYQCVKYKAVLDAESKVHGLFSNNRVYLVVEGRLSDSNLQIKDTLGVSVIEVRRKEE